jgi:hypothetical protein
MHPSPPVDISRSRKKEYAYQTLFINRDEYDVKTNNSPQNLKLLYMTASPTCLFSHPYDPQQEEDHPGVIQYMNIPPCLHD